MSKLTLTATLEERGSFPKYLVRIAEELLFLDLATITEISENGQKFRVEIFGWELGADLILFKSGNEVSDSLPKTTEKPHTGEKILYTMCVDGAFRLVNLRDAGCLYDSGWVKVEFGPYVIDNQFKVYAMSERHKSYISNAADEYSASK